MLPFDQQVFIKIKRIMYVQQVLLQSLRFLILPSSLKNKIKINNLEKQFYSYWPFELR